MTSGPWYGGAQLGRRDHQLLCGAYPELVSKLVVIEGIGLWQRDVEDTSLAEKLRLGGNHPELGRPATETLRLLRGRVSAYAAG